MGLPRPWQDRAERTGLSLIVPDIAGKCLELLKQAVPSANRIAYLWHPGDYGEHTERDILNGAEAGARTLGVQFQPVPVRGPEDFEQAFSDMVSAGVEALTVLGSNILILERRRLVDLAAKHRLPAI